LAEECAQALAEGGASELVVHARTKSHAYRPPAFWERVADIKAVVSIPVIANGEIWTLADALRCREASGCQDLMLGRGMVADPGLALAILAHDAQQLRASCAGTSPTPERGITWPALLPLLGAFWHLICAHIDPRHRAGRLKQWMNYLRRSYPEAQAAYDEIRTLNDPRVIEAWLQQTGALGATPSPAGSALADAA
jgi:tRNA-dihydrouridine synthase C